jgi:tetratricopeptide (TPR) repeat protein
MTPHASDLPANSLYQLASRSRRAGLLFAAIGYYRQLVRAIDPADQHALAQVLWELGTACLDFDHSQTAIAVLEHAREAAHAARLPVREAECLTGLGQACRQTQQLSRSLSYCQQAHSLFSDLEPDAALARLWIQQGLTHAQSGASAEAREDYTQAHSVATTIADQLLQVEALRYLGNLCAVDLGERERGIGYLEEALVLLRAREDLSTRTIAITVVRTLAELSGLKMQRKETIGEVFDLLVEAQGLAPQTGDPALTARISYLMDGATLMLGKYAHQSPTKAASKTGDDDLAFYEE